MFTKYTLGIFIDIEHKINISTFIIGRFVSFNSKIYMSLNFTHRLNFPSIIVFVYIQFLNLIFNNNIFIYEHTSTYTHIYIIVCI